MSIRIQLRSLLRSRVFLITAVLVLGLGLGVNLTLLNTAYALLWRPLNFVHPERLAILQEHNAAGEQSNAVTGRDAWALRSHTQVVAEIGLVGWHRLVSVLREDEVLDMPSAAVDSGYFRALAIQPIAGRLFVAEEDLGSEQIAVLTESAWRTYFASDPSIVGRSVVLQAGGSRSEVRVIGVVSAKATLPFAPDAEILFPLPSAHPSLRANAGDALYRSVIRLRPDVTLQHASAEVDAALRALGPNEAASGRRYSLQPLRDTLAPVKPVTVLLLYGSACLLLLLTCANLTSLFVARALAATHEIGIRMALGATRWRLLQSNFQEALLLCAAGTGFAFLIESWARPLVPRLMPAVRDIGAELLTPGPALLAFAMAICVGVAMVMSAASGVRFRMDGLAGVLAQNQRSGGSSYAGASRAFLCAAQLAIVVTLLTVSAMVGRSFLLALHSNSGLDASGLLTFQVSLPGGSQRPQAAIISDLTEHVAAIPGVKGVSFAAELPVGSAAFSTTTAPRPGELRPTDPHIPHRLIGPSYFEVIGAKLTAGQAFSTDDVRQIRPVVILNKTAAQLLFPGQSALGRTIHCGFGDLRSVVVGIVSDIRTDGLDQSAPPMIYMPYRSDWGLRLIVRSNVSPTTLIPILRDRARTVNAGILLQRFRTVAEILNGTVRDRMMASMLIGGFAIIGLIISLVGLYGTLAAHVQQRRVEIAVRIALGATVPAIVSTVLREGLSIVICGAFAGTLLSFVAGRVIKHELYGITTIDIPSFVAALALLGITTGVACLVPAIRAARMDSVEALKVG